MQIPEIPTLPADIMESLPYPVQEHIRGLEGIIELLQVVIQQHTQPQTQHNQLQSQITELQERLAQNSENSSKPPSSNTPWTRPPKTPKASSGKKRGGQAGHTRNLRQLLPTTEIDDIREWWPALCQECKAPLRASDQIGTPKRHQVTEIERVTAHVIEHPFFACECSGCGALTKTSHPKDVPTGNFGPELVATLADLHGRYRLSMRETATLAKDLWQVDLSVGAVADACQKASFALAESYTEAHTHLKAHSSEVNVDETGWRDSGKRSWLWVAVSKVATVFKFSPKRNRASFQELVPPAYLGVVGSDRYNAYYALDPARHQLCWTHLIRNLRGLAVRAGPTSAWAIQSQVML
jgi:transposase